LLGPSSQLPAVDRFVLPVACSTEELIVSLVDVFGVGLDDLLGVVIEGFFDEAGTTFIGVSGFFELTSDEIVDGLDRVQTLWRDCLDCPVCLRLYLRTITHLTFW
jgi:hypothetical protein